MRKLLTDETGTVGGVEALPFGVLVFVVGTLIVVCAWGVVDAKLAVAGAAREAVRSYVEAPPNSDPAHMAEQTAVDALRAAGRTAHQPSVTVHGTFARCERVRATITYPVPAVRLPWVGSLGTFTVRSTASEIVDPIRSGIPGEATCVS